MPLFQSWIKSNRIKSVDKILCAVSGGCDSMVLLDLFRRANIKIEVMHMNYQLRGEASDLDQSLVENICAKHNIKCHSKSTTKPIKCNTQEWARDERYAFINALDKENNYDYIATAHHLQDQLETNLLSIFKGYSLQTIKSIRGKLVRPLININKEDILLYASANDIEYRQDQSNFSNVYDRNFLRNELIPKLQNRFQNFDKRVVKFAERQTNKNDLLDTLIEEKVKSFSSTETNNLSTNFFENIKLTLLNEKEGKTTLSYYLEKKYGFNQVQVENLLNSKQAGVSILNNETICKKDQNQIVIGDVATKDSIELLIQKSDLPFQFTKLKIGIAKTLQNPKISSQLLVDYDVLDFPLKVRKVTEFDKFHAFGLRGKSTSLTKYLKDKGISSVRRLHEFLIIDSSDRIIMPGIEIDYSLKITNNSKTSLFIDLQDKST